MGKTSLQFHVITIHFNFGFFSDFLVIEDGFLGIQPNFTLRPRDTLAMLGSKAILFCGAYGLGADMNKPTITWLKNERAIDL